MNLKKPKTPTALTDRIHGGHEVKKFI